MRPLLILRPEPGATATLKRALEAGLNATAAPLFKIDPVSWQAPPASAFDGLLVTSANAVRTAGDALDRYRALPVYAVGEATAAAARREGLDIAAAGEWGAERLLSSIPPCLRLLHLAGQDRHDLNGATQQIMTVTVYRSTPLDTPDLSSAGGAVALIHSPRAGRRLAELVKDRARIAIAAISREAAEAVGGGWSSIDHAELPSDEALLVLAARLCNNSLPK